MFRCFKDDFAAVPIDQEPRKFGHKLTSHPAVSLENISRLILKHPKNQIVYSKGLLKNGDDFENAQHEHGNGLSIEETIETIRTSNSYIYVVSPELDPSFRDLHRELVADVEAVMKRQGLGDSAIDTSLHLFIASPGAFTPFHIDRYSTILMQARGSKEVCIFPSWDERVVSSPDREQYLAYKKTKLPWAPEMDALATRFDFSPGESVHIPFVAGHYVRNGSDDVSISLSITFNTNQSMAWRRTIAFNRIARPHLLKLGAAPDPVGASRWRDAAKAGTWAKVAGLSRALQRDKAQI
jgi:Cupin-like domain